VQVGDGLEAVKPSVGVAVALTAGVGVALAFAGTSVAVGAILYLGEKVQAVARSITARYIATIPFLL